MSEIYIDKYHYSNPNVRPYLCKTDFTCSSGALHIAYKALGLNYPEIQIIRDFNQGFSGNISWTEMIDHTESHNFSADFIEGCSYETLLAPLYEVPYVIIVGWIANNDPVIKMYHCSPVRFVSLEDIALTNVGRHGLMKFTKERFISVWKDYTYEHPFMTIRQKNTNQ